MRAFPGAHASRFLLPSHAFVAFLVLLLFLFRSVGGLQGRSSCWQTLTMSSDSLKLSKNLLRMKFMQRGLDAETKKQLRENEKRIISDEHWNPIVEERSFVPFEELLYGRMSFKGFNPEVEKLMAQMNPRQDRREDEDVDAGRMQTDVTDEEMALRYESLVGSLKKKFARKRERGAVEDDLPEDDEKNPKRKM
ncbi:M-phase phosphoprotein 6 isoform X2 [Syngnathoides biaculeatus]|uniref:M-phase phosphoprotein 6 isoform X2 n=1 Tax=Syngnathoides biaculeatus TaxID=300417 RepID=UPI002ADE8150|nr:M-phase phosphoprotein 6 isoform X2 [Syngnathoides biaculeatus]